MRFLFVFFSAVYVGCGCECRPVVAVCTCARSASTWRRRSDSTFFSLFLPSVLRSVSESERRQWDVRLFVAIDDDDVFFSTLLGNSTTIGWLPVTVTMVPRQMHRVPFNENANAAYSAGASYFVRVNDDTEFTTAGWLRVGISALSEMGNVGVVGPVCSEGNREILTHDMTHRTHMDIFDNEYYPAAFSAWWVDDWITRVYGLRGRVRVLRSWRVTHHLSRHAVRHHEKRLLRRAISRGLVAIDRWLEASDPMFADGIAMVAPVHT
jgi:hypothetical protein